MSEPTFDLAALEAPPWATGVEAVCLGSEGYVVVESFAKPKGIRRRRVAFMGYETWEFDKRNAHYVADLLNAAPHLIRAARSLVEIAKSGVWDPDECHNCGEECQPGFVDDAEFVWCTKCYAARMAAPFLPDTTEGGDG